MRGGDAEVLLEVTGIGDLPQQGAGGRRLGRAQPHPVVVGAGAARKVAGERAQAVLARRRCLAHANAPQTSGLVQTGAGVHQREQMSVGGQVLQRLARRRVHVEGDTAHGLPFLHDLGHHREVAPARVRRRAHHDLVHGLVRHFAHGHHVAGARRAGDEGLERRKVDLLVDVVGRVAIGHQLGPGVLSALGPQETAGGVVGREHRRGGTELGAHVGDHPAPPTLHVMAPQHLEHHVLGAHPVGERASEPHPPHLGHGDVQGLTGHGQRDLEAAHPDGEHAEGAGRAGMAVGAGEGRSWAPEALHVHGMADAVAGPGEPDAEALAGGVQEEVVVGVAVVGLEEVVVDVLRRQLGPDPIEVHGLELEHDRGARGVLGQGLVDANADLLPRRHLAFDEVVFDQLLSDVPAHGVHAICRRVAASHRRGSDGPRRREPMGEATIRRRRGLPFLRLQGHMPGVPLTPGPRRPATGISACPAIGNEVATVR